MKQVVLARKARISESHISRICGGSRRPKYHVAKRLARITGTEIALWLEGNPAEIKEKIRSL